MSNWTEDRAAAARAMWNEGKSALEIAVVLGEGLTRNAVIAKLDRAGLVGIRSRDRASWGEQTRQAPSPPRTFSWEAAA